MAFFLLGRSEDGGLSLLSDAAFESRQEALAELGRITADLVFDKWSDEVLLIDLEAGTPVLLVRPAEATVAAPEAVDAEPEDGPEPAVFAAMADEETEVAASDDREDSDADQAESDDAESDADVADEPEEQVDAADADEPSEADEPVDAGSDGMDALRDAIARTTEHMEASGIVAPESIGPADEAHDTDEPAQDAATVESEPDGESEPAAESDDAPEAASDSDEPAEVPAPEPPAWPWATASDADTPTGDMASERSTSDGSFKLEGLEDPEIDDGGSLIAASIDDESLAANRPVILGAYGETSEDQEPAGHVAGEPLTDTADEAADEEAADDAEDETAIVADDDPDPEVESDFIVLDSTSDAPESLEGDETVAHDESDLDAIEPADAAADSPLAHVEEDDTVPALSSYVCDDCVYVDTCPNKDQRRPEDCGSFQWK